MSVHESGEMYLEAIWVLREKKGFVRSVDVSEYLGYSKPSVSRAMGILRQGEYIVVENDGSITLTDTGREIAINEVDIDNFIRAKGAIFSAIDTDRKAHV